MRRKARLVLFMNVLPVRRTRKAVEDVKRFPAISGKPLRTLSDEAFALNIKERVDRLRLK